MRLGHTITPMCQTQPLLLWKITFLETVSLFSIPWLSTDRTYHLSQSVSLNGELFYQTHSPTPMSSFIPEMGGLIVPLHGDDDESGRVNERVRHKTPFSRTVGGKWPKTHSRRGERGKVMGHFSHRGARGLSPLQVRGHCGPSGDAKLQMQSYYTGNRL